MTSFANLSRPDPEPLAAEQVKTPVSGPQYGGQLQILQAAATYQASAGSLSSLHGAARDVTTWSKALAAKQR
jgi:hypothetical protein